MKPVAFRAPNIKYGKGVKDVQLTFGIYGI
jgi:hypothetical protein